MVLKVEFLNNVYVIPQLFVIVLFTYTVLLLRWINNMVDLYLPKATNDLHIANDALVSLTTLKRFSKDQRHRKQLSREADLKARDAQLFEVKNNIPDVHVTSKRPFSGLCCQTCTSVSRESLLKSTTEYLAIRNIIYQHGYRNDTLFVRIFSHLYEAYGLKRFTYPYIESAVLSDDRLKKAIEKAAVQQFQDADTSEDEFYQDLLKQNKKRAEKMLHNMRSTLSDFLLRFTSWILYKFLPCFLTSVAVHPGQIEMLKEAGKSNLPLVFLPLHKSHLDYVLVSFILINNGIRPPLVAAGDNLRIPFFGALLRGLGAFYIKRRVDPVMGRKDYVYKAVLHTYMNLCLRAGHNLEFFLEGGRTRTGKPLMPKYGILSSVLDTFMDGTIEDALLVPVSVNYEKLVDGNFTREQLGQPKEKETFSKAVKGIWNILNSNYGMMRIDFGQPFSLKEMTDAFNAKHKPAKTEAMHRILKSNLSTNSLYGMDVVSDEQKSLVENISKHVLYSCAEAQSVMSTNALAFLLLSKYRNGATLDDLTKGVDTLRKELEFAHRDVGFSGESADVVLYAVEMLGSLVSLKKQNDDVVIKPVTSHPQVIELSYYSNTVLSVFALDAVLATALRISCKCDIVNHEELIENTLDLCNIFQYEFLFCKPCQDLEQVVVNAIDDLLVTKGVFLAEEHSELVQRSRKIAAQFDDDDEDNENKFSSKTYKLNKSQYVLDHLVHLQNAMMPLIEAYSMTAYCLDKMVHQQLLETEYVGEVTQEMQIQLIRGSLKFGESVAVDYIKNALKLFQKWDVLESYNEKALRFYNLKDRYDDKSLTKEIYDRLNKFRQY